MQRHHPRKRMIQYSAMFLVNREFAAYWMPAFAGMTGGNNLVRLTLRRRHRQRRLLAGKRHAGLPAVQAPYRAGDLEHLPGRT
jgi:hypothetical protein